MRRKISIQPLNHGYLVRVGCQSIAFETTAKLLDELRDYLLDPEKTEHIYMETSTPICEPVDQPVGPPTTRGASIGPIQGIGAIPFDNKYQSPLTPTQKGPL